MSAGYAIKQAAEDFIVEEVADTSALCDHGEYLIVEVEKEGLNTEAARRILAAALHKSERDIAFAGLKDKRAKTTQLFSIAHASARTIRDFSHPQMKLRAIGFQDFPLHLGSHTHNRFTINVEIMTLGARIAYDQGTTRIAAQPLLLNYFDEQRFSKNNVEAGLALVRKEFTSACGIIAGMDLREAQAMREHLAGHPTDLVGALLRLPPPLLQLFLHALQSRIWNDTLATYMRSHAPREAHDVAYSQGALAFPDDATELVSLQGVQVPLAGFGMERDARFDAIIAEELKKLGITERDFIIRQLPKASCEGGERAASAPILNFTHEEISETRARLSFTLPKGSYATMVLKQLFLE